MGISKRYLILTNLSSYRSFTRYSYHHRIIISCNIYISIYGEDNKITVTKKERLDISEHHQTTQYTYPNKITRCYSNNIIISCYNATIITTKITTLEGRLAKAFALLGFLLQILP